MANVKTSKRQPAPPPKIFQGVTISQAEQQAFLEALDTLRGLVLKMKIGFTCATCEHFDADKGGYCHYWNDIVPDMAQAKGCDNWSDLIPF